ncbi:MAG TPA: citramalate synthase [Candidatus Limnocylindrales bacterium]|nr:citramalate synthase [Candidatus Limnocylindrales bacterium]
MPSSVGQEPTGDRIIEIYDTTLRDGTQGEGVSYTVDDKVAVARKLDEFGVSVIEGGWPGSNPRDAAFFELIRGVKLSRAKIAAFGSTIRPGTDPADDANMKALLAAETPVVTIVAKTWDLHVHEDLRIELDENLELISKSIAYLKERTDRVILDAEHFFDGYAANHDYAMQCLEAAVDAGVDLLCLCDTRGGSLPRDVAAATREVGALGVPIGIHCHNDSGLAVANSLASIEAGASQVQGTINGFGERCGNANLCTVVPNLQIKMGYRCVSPQQLARVTEVSRFCAELANVELERRLPYVGRSAFAHKGGLHVAAVRKNAVTYEHIDPTVVGNEQRVLVSDLSGRSNVMHKAEQFGIDVAGRHDELASLLSHLKELEYSGFQFEGADASFELLMRRNLDPFQRFFRLLGFRVTDEKRSEDGHTRCEATVMLEGPDGAVEHTAAEGNGPVNALDLALRKALTKFYPGIEKIHLHDYKVRVLDGTNGTESRVRVLIESGDGTRRWGTVGVSHNVVEASWQALVDSFVYFLLSQEERAASRRKSAAASSSIRRKD